MVGKPHHPSKMQKTLAALMRVETGIRLLTMARRGGPKKEIEGVINERAEIPRSAGGGSIRTRIYKPKGGGANLPIMVFYHGGGYATGWPERHHAFYQRIMQTRPCIIVAPAFRLSIEAPYPAGHDDCYDALLWARDHAQELGGDPAKIILAGNSSGGGLALSTALRARDENSVRPAFIAPLYPMIEDRGDRWSEIDRDLISWEKGNSVLAWHLLLKPLRLQKRVVIPAYAVPARAEDVSGLPPVLSYIGTQDIFRLETETMMQRLSEAGSEVTFRVFEHTYHAMEDREPDLPRAQEINQWAAQEFGRMMDTYCT